MEMLKSPAVLRAARHRLRLHAFCTGIGLRTGSWSTVSSSLQARRSTCGTKLVHSNTRLGASVQRAASTMVASAERSAGPTGRELVGAVKKKAAGGAPRKALELLAAAHDKRDSIPVPSDAYRSAARALIRADRPDLALAAYRLRAASAEPEDPGLSAAIVRACLRGGTGLRRDVKRETALGAEEALQNLLDGSATAVRGETMGQPSSFAEALCVTQIAFLKAEQQDNALRAARVLQDLAPLGSRAAAETKEYNELIRWYGKRRLMKGVFATMNAMRAAGVSPNAETFEFLANSAVRSVRFVTGAVSMSTLPHRLPAEVAFCGRSNVGKSSLVNMLVNRKALARVSGTPGKTQQFNYFIVNENVEGSKYYLVDLPGVGYAKVPKSIRDPWVGFMRSYFAGRPSLQAVFHLIDGRHGPLADDEALMKMIAESGFQGEYAVVLTKMDKMDKQKVKIAVLNKVANALQKSGCPAKTPVIVTSSATKLGRDELWRHLQRALRHTVPVL